MMKNKRSTKNIVANIIIIVLCIFLFLFTITFIGETIEYNKSYTYDDTTLLRYVSYQQYVDLVDAVYANEAKGVSVKKDMEEVYALAHYYNNAVLYYAYQGIGDMEQAQIKYEKMQEYEAQLDEYAYVTEEIRNDLEARD